MRPGLACEDLDTYNGDPVHDMEVDYDFHINTGELPAESEEDLLEHRTDGTDAFDTLYIGCEKFPFHDSFSLSTSGVL